jgi:hypothetical protein
VFSNIQTAKNGGAFYFVNITNNITILNSNFTKINGDGNGGAISFGEGTTFIINQSRFFSCSSLAGYGGAFSSSSNKTEPRYVSFTTFGLNSAYLFMGLDIYDLSNNGYSFYSLNNIVGCVSTSTQPTEHILFAATQVFFFFNFDLSCFI